MNGSHRCPSRNKHSDVEIKLGVADKTIERYLTQIRKVKKNVYPWFDLWPISYTVWHFLEFVWTFWAYCWDKNGFSMIDLNWSNLILFMFRKLLLISIFEKTFFLLTKQIVWWRCKRVSHQNITTENYCRQLELLHQMLQILALLSWT